MTGWAVPAGRSRRIIEQGWMHASRSQPQTHPQPLPITLQQRQELTDVAAGGEAQAADEAGAQVRDDVTVQVGHAHHVELGGPRDQLRVEWGTEGAGEEGVRLAESRCTHASVAGRHASTPSAAAAQHRTQTS